MLSSKYLLNNHGNVGSLFYVQLHSILISPLSECILYIITCINRHLDIFFQFSFFFSVIDCFFVCFNVIMENMTYFWYNNILLFLIFRGCDNNYEIFKHKDVLIRHCFANFLKKIIFELIWFVITCFFWLHLLCINLHKRCKLLYIDIL